MSTNRGMDEEDVVHIYNEILLSNKKEHIWVSLNKVDEARAYYKEWSQKEKNKYCVLTHIHGIEKVGADEHIFRAAMEMPRWH